MRNAHRLAGKTAIVTGGSRGIGRAVAVLFAREGASVVVNHFGHRQDEPEVLSLLETATGEFLREAETQRALGLPVGPSQETKPHHLVMEADVADSAAVQAMVAQTIESYGSFHILVNNAAIQTATPGDSFAETDLDRILAVDLVGPALCARAALRHFIDKTIPGTIINTTSVHEIVPKPGFAAYSIAKGGLGNLTRTLALEFADRGIRVNAVGPGAVATEMNAAWVNDPAGRAKVENHIPMGRAAEPDDVAPLFAFLASDEARYITGQTIYACGGLTLYGEFKTNWAS